MRTNRIVWFIGVLAVALWVGCSDDDDTPTGDTGGGTGDSAVSNQDTGSGTEDAGTPAEAGTTGEDGTESSTVGQACQNPDGNTHTDCTGDTDYCVPDVTGVEASGLTKLTCTKKDCDPNNASTCPGGMTCKVIPDFVVKMMQGQGIEMPSSICAG